MTVKLVGSSSGSVALDAPASTTGGANIEFKLPVADGSADQVITTNGSGQLQFATIAGSPVKQIKNYYQTSNFTTTSSSYTDITNASLSITPTSATNKIKVTLISNIFNGHSSYTRTRAQIKILKDNVEAHSIVYFAGHQGPGNDYLFFPMAFEYVETAGNTSARTYKMQIARAEGNQTLTMNGFSYTVQEFTNA